MPASIIMMLVVAKSTSTCIRNFGQNSTRIFVALYTIDIAARTGNIHSSETFVTPISIGAVNEASISMLNNFFLLVADHFTSAGMGHIYGT